MKKLSERLTIDDEKDCLFFDGKQINAPAMEFLLRVRPKNHSVRVVSVTKGILTIETVTQEAI